MFHAYRWAIYSHFPAPYLFVTQIFKKKSTQVLFSFVCRTLVPLFILSIAVSACVCAFSSLVFQMLPLVAAIYRAILGALLCEYNSRSKYSFVLCDGTQIKGILVVQRVTIPFVKLGGGFFSNTEICETLLFVHVHPCPFTRAHSIGSRSTISDLCSMHVPSCTFP